MHRRSLLSRHIGIMRKLALGIGIIFPLYTISAYATETSSINNITVLSYSGGMLENGTFYAGSDAGCQVAFPFNETVSSNNIPSSITYTIGDMEYNLAVSGPETTLPLQANQSGFFTITYQEGDIQVLRTLEYIVSENGSPVISAADSDSADSGTVSFIIEETSADGTICSGIDNYFCLVDEQPYEDFTVEELESSVLENDVSAPSLIKLTLTLPDSNAHTISITATDKCGNTTEYTIDTGTEEVSATDITDEEESSEETESIDEYTIDETSEELSTENESTVEESSEELSTENESTEEDSTTDETIEETSTEEESATDETIEEISTEEESTTEECTSEETTEEIVEDPLTESAATDSEIVSMLLPTDFTMLMYKNPNDSNTLVESQDIPFINTGDTPIKVNITGVRFDANDTLSGSVNQNLSVTLKQHNKEDYSFTISEGQEDIFYSIILDPHTCDSSSLLDQASRWNPLGDVTSSDYATLRICGDLGNGNWNANDISVHIIFKFETISEEEPLE